MAEEANNDNDTVFLRNLSYDSNEEALKAFIEENFGKTKYCLICRNKETGDSRGTGFAKFEEAENAEKCLREFKDTEFQHKFHFDGRNIIVLPVIPKGKVDEVKQDREKEILRQERHKRRERLIKERVLAKQNKRRPNPVGQKSNPRAQNQAPNRANFARNRPNQSKDRSNQSAKKPNRPSSTPSAKTKQVKKNKASKKSQTKLKNKNKAKKNKAS